MRCRSASTGLPIWSAVSEPEGSVSVGRPLWRIGEVVGALAEEFPDLTVSKVRYLQSRGLITPVRTPGGTRVYSRAHVDTLRFILRSQRDDFLPLAIIAERINASVGQALPTVTGPMLLSAPDRRPLSKAELAEGSGLGIEVINECIEQGLIRGLDAGALTVCQAVAALMGYGLDPRHLRSVRLAVDREVALIEAVAATPKGGMGAEHGLDERDAITAAILRLHVALLVHSPPA